jgi:hypothetical protein
MAFKLTESFKGQYKTYLQEKQSREDYSKSLNEFEQAQKHAEAGFDVIKEYFAYFSEKNGLLEVEGLPPGKGPANPQGSANPKPAEKNKGDEAIKRVSDTINNVFNIVGRSVEDFEDSKSKIDDYQPVVGHMKVEKISEMRFPENVIFFFQQLISWIVNIVKKFISFFTTAIQRFFNIPEAKSFDEELKLNLQRSRKIESIAMPLSYRKDKEGRLPTAVTLLGFEPKDVEKFRSLLPESVKLNEDEREVKAETSPSRQTIAIDINISKEMEGIQQLLQHFLELFDNAYGSNREKLFGTEDLDMILQLFKKTIEQLGDASVSTTAIGGKLTSMELLDSGKLKDNMVRTKVNTDNLKRVYVQIEQGISNMLAVLSHKQLIALESLGASYRFYSASTYIQMIKILDAIRPRIKQSEDMEKDLKKMKGIFDNIVITLNKMREPLMAFGQVTYTSVYQKRINDLFDGARYVSQTISLRLATLGLFIRQIKDINEAIYTVNSMNERSKDMLKKAAFSF